MTTELRVQRRNERAKLPVRVDDGAAGYDIFSAEAGVIAPRKRARIATGISIQVPDGTYGRICPRSGLAWWDGIDVGGGVVDASFRSNKTPLSMFK